MSASRFASRTIACGSLLASRSLALLGGRARLVTSPRSPDEAGGGDFNAEDERLRCLSLAAAVAFDALPQGNGAGTERSRSRGNSPPSVGSERAPPVCEAAARVIP